MVGYVWDAFLPVVSRCPRITVGGPLTQDFWLPHEAVWVSTAGTWGGGHVCQMHRKLLSPGTQSEF
jgi:hypothetical protein